MIIKKTVTVGDRFRYPSSSDFVREVRGCRRMPERQESHWCLGCKQTVPADFPRCPFCGRRSF